MVEGVCAEKIKILKMGVSEDCIIRQESGLLRNPPYQLVRAFGDIIAKWYIKSLFLRKSHTK